MADRVSKKAEVIRDKIQTAMDTKVKIQEVTFLKEITDWSEKDNRIKQCNERLICYKTSTAYRIKHETLDSDDETVPKEKEHVAGDPDGHFMFTKENENDPEAHNYKCEECKRVFRDYNELRNHDSNHGMEFYRCMICLKVYRSLRSFETHHASHSKSHTCQTCGKVFQLKSSLTNHLQCHSTKPMRCTHPGCTYTNKHRQNQLEHIQWAHHDKKECPCNICGKLFQTPYKYENSSLEKTRFCPSTNPWLSWCCTSM